MSLEKRIARDGGFSSSSMWKLHQKARDKVSFGEKALTYIKQVGYEIDLGRSINKETSARSTSWGKVTELQVFNLLPLDYKLVSTDRLVHPTISMWTGAPDLEKSDTIAEVKCPYSLEVFCDKIAALADGIDTYRKEYPEDFWQHISNSILLNLNGRAVTHFEAIIYMPYEREIVDIRRLVSEAPDEMHNSLKWFDYVDNDELPYLNEGGKYKNLNIFRFPIPADAVQEQTDIVLRAKSLLPPSLVTPTADRFLAERR